MSSPRKLNTHRIEIQANLNPGGSVTALLDVGCSDSAGPVEFSYTNTVKGERSATELSTFEKAFLETLAESNVAERGFAVQVHELAANPNNQDRYALAGAFAARELLKQIKR